MSVKSKAIQILFLGSIFGAWILLVSGCAKTRTASSQVDTITEDVESLLDIARTNKNPDVRFEAITKFMKLGNEDASAIKDLQKIALADRSSLVRANAIKAMGSLGRNAIPALPVITQALLEHNIDVAIQAAAALQCIAADTPSSEQSHMVWKNTHKALLEALEKPDRRLKKTVLGALLKCNLSEVEKSDLRKAVTIIFENDRDSFLPILSILIEAPTKTILPLLQDAMSYPEAAYWISVVVSVSAREMGSLAEDLLPEFCRIVSDEDALTSGRFQAILAIAAINKRNEKVVSTLVSCLTPKENLLPSAAVFALGQLQTHSAVHQIQAVESANDQILSCLRDWALFRIKAGEGLVRANEIQCLVNQIDRISESSATDQQRQLYLVLPAIASLYKVASREQQQIISQSISRLLAFDDVPIRTATLTTVLNNDIPVTEVIGNALGSDATKSFAISTLVRFGSDSKVVTNSLLNLLKTENNEKKQEILLAIGKTGRSSSLAVKELGNLLDDPTEQIQIKRLATFVAGKFGENATSLYGSINRLRTNNDPLLMVLANWAITRLDSQDRQLRENVIQSLSEIAENSHDVEMRQAAIKILTDIDTL